MSVPKQSFIIWFSPRTGSSLLCKSLEDTGVCGKAGECLNDQGDQSLASYYQIKNFDQLCANLWHRGTSVNGIFGVKYSCYRFHHERVGRELAGLQKLEDTQPTEWKVMSKIFPNCKHIFLTRRNKIRTAVSWWKAIQDDIWHLKQGSEATKDTRFYQDKYDAPALRHLLREHCLREAYTGEFFTKNQIVPMTIVYEDFIADYEGTLRRILAFLGIRDGTMPIEPPYYQKTSDENSEAWIQQFRDDLQQGWDKPAW